MKKATSKIVSPDHKLSGKDYYQIFTSALMVILGAVILFHSFSGNVIVMPLLVGGGFLGLGIYRLNFLFKYLEERRKWNHR